MTERRRRQRRRLASRRRRELSLGPRAPAATRASFSLAPAALERAYPEIYRTIAIKVLTIHLDIYTHTDRHCTMCCNDKGHD